MRLTIVAVDIAVARFTLKIRDPGAVRKVVWNVTKKVVLRAGQPEMEETPAIMVEARMDAPIREHTFACIPHGEVLELADDERAKYIDTGISGASGRVVHLFEIFFNAHEGTVH